MREAPWRILRCGEEERCESRAVEQHRRRITETSHIDLAEDEEDLVIADQVGRVVVLCQQENLQSTDCGACTESLASREPLLAVETLEERGAIIGGASDPELRGIIVGGTESSDRAGQAARSGKLCKLIVLRVECNHRCRIPANFEVSSDDQMSVGHPNHRRDTTSESSAW